MINIIKNCAQERGRENVSFPVVEILKPQGFKERSDGGMLEYLSGAPMPGIDVLK